MEVNNLLNKVDTYYTNKILTHGSNNKGVDWNSKESQEMRFIQLLKIIESNSKFSIIDLGCGYGYLYEFLKKNNYNFSYCGLDISKTMIKVAEELYNENDCKFINQSKINKKADYCVSSGIFNVKFDSDYSNWTEHILSTLNDMNDMSIKGFAFNCLTKYSDEEYMKEHLYYGDPCYLFDYCKKNFSNNVALLHDYDLYEFSIIVKK